MRRSIVISGASSGLGAALALNYAGPDAALFLTARNAERLEAVALDCAAKGAEVETMPLDINDTEGVRAWIDAIDERAPIDLAVVNAGILDTHGPGRALEDATKALGQIATNLGGSVNLVTAVAPHMQARQAGQIALIASLSGLQPLADLPAYSASKAGVIAYGEALSSYLSRDGVTVSVICPGYVATPMTQKYENWRPFEMTAPRAAARIRRALDRRRAFYAFPWPMVLSIRLGRLLPPFLRRHATRAFDYKR